MNPTLWQQGPSGERQYKCNDWGGIYSTTNTWRIQFIRDFAGLPTGGGCGGRHDYYGTWGSHAVNWNGTWYPANVGYSRWLWSGWHYLPTTPSLSNRDIALKGLDVPAAAVPQDPAWVDPHTMQAIPGKVPKYMQRFFDNAVTAEEGTPGVLTKDAVTDTSWRLVEARAPILPGLSDSLP